jgi:hypothetical protein
MAYVYTHTRLDKNEVFYVGIGSDSKGKYTRSKRTDNRSVYWKQVYSKTKISIEIVSDNISWKNACEIESYLIMFFGRKDLCKGSLVNLTNGGDGAFGAIRSPETRERIRISSTGRKQSKEQIEKRRLSRIGYKASAETIEKMRLSQMGKKHSAERIAKKIGVKKSKECIEKMKISRRGRVFSDETRKKISMANKGKVRSQEAKDKIRKAMIGTKSTPERIENIRLAKKRNRELRMRLNLQPYIL